MMKVWGVARRTTLWALCAVVIIGASAGHTHAAGASPARITARAAVVMDVSTGQLLWQSNPDMRLPPASTTKILTSVLALESGRLDESFPVSRRAQDTAPSKLALRVGERVELRDLVYSLMLKSANDSAVVVAEGLGGSVESFAARMNERARKAGAVSSRFRNPHGLPDSEHVSTARDLALILRSALDVPGFRTVASTTARSVQVSGAKSKVKKISLRTKNRFLTGYRVPVIGKTGYTRAARRCFAGAASANGRDVIVVVLGASDLWGDIKKLLDWGLEASAPSEPLPLLQMARDEPAPPPSAPNAVAAPARAKATLVASTPKKATPPRAAVAVAAAPPPAKKVPPPQRTVAKASSRATRQVVRAEGDGPSSPSRAPVVAASNPSARPPTKGVVRRGCTGSGCGSR